MEQVQQKQQLASVDWQSLKPVSAAKAQQLEGANAFTVGVEPRLFGLFDCNVSRLPCSVSAVGS